jgi:hypothetical protein
MIFSKKYFFTLLLFLSAVKSFSLDVVNLWRHSEIAEKNSVFLDIGLPPVTFTGYEFAALPLDIRIDYMLPVPVPVSAGVYMKTPYPNLKSFGIRIGYHFDLDIPKTDLYVVYTYEFGFIRTGILLEYNDTPPKVYNFDFRIGVRRFFGTFGLALESGHKFHSVIILFSIKLN